MSDQAINNFCVPGGMHYFRGLTTGRCDCGVREAPVLVDRETYDALNAERDALMAERYKLASDIVAAQRREAEAYRLRAVAVEVADRLTAENGHLQTELAAERERNQPLRQRIKEAQDRADRALAPLQKDLAYLRNLMIEATHHYENNQPELHRLRVERLIAQCSDDFKDRIERFPLSAYNRATLAVLLGRNRQIEADRDALLAENDRLREAIQAALVHYDNWLHNRPQTAAVAMIVAPLRLALAAAQPPAAGTEGTQ